MTNETPIADMKSITGTDSNELSQTFRTFGDSHLKALNLEKLISWHEIFRTSGSCLKSTDMYIVYREK